MMSGLGAATDFTVDQDFETTGDNEFTSIQAAVDAAESGDTIEVTSGTYDESVTITTSEVTLTNASGELPKLEMPSDSEKGFYIRAESVEISNFVIEGKGFNAEELSGPTGIRAANDEDGGPSDNSVIENVEVSNVLTAVQANSESVEIKDNDLHDVGVGISLQNVSNVVTGNQISSVEIEGIGVAGSNHEINSNQFAVEEVPDVRFYVDVISESQEAKDISDSNSGVDNVEFFKSGNSYPGPVTNEDSGLTYQTIQTAINDAETEDKITVEQGNYDELIRTSVEGLELVAPNGATIQPSQETVEDAGRTRVVDLGGDTHNYDDVTFSGFKVDGSNTNGVWVGIKVTGEDNVVKNNSVSNIWTGIQTTDGNANHAVIENNKVSDSKVGISIQSNNAEVLNNHFQDLSAEGMGIGSGDENPTSNITVVGNTFETEVDHINFYHGTNGELNLEEIMNNNDFNGLVVNKDQKLGVMFDSPLSKTLYSSIQTAVDEAVTSGETQTVHVTEGEYEENVEINNSVVLEGEGKESVIKSDSTGVLLTGNTDDLVKDVTVRDLKVAPESGSGIFSYSNLGDSLWDSQNVSLENLDIEMSTGNTAIGLMSTKDAEISNVEVSGSQIEAAGALELVGVENLNISDSTFENNALGLKVKYAEGYGENSNIEIRNTVFEENAVAVENADESIKVDAKHNYWGQSSGPEEGQVVGDVTFQPWLLEENGEVYDQTVGLGDGWSTVSIPGNVEQKQLVGDGHIYSYDASSEGSEWQKVGLDEINSAQAVAVTPEVEALGFNYADESASSTSLNSGWNLVGLPGGQAFQSVLSTAQTEMESFSYPAENLEKSHGFRPLEQTGLVNSKAIFDSREVLSGTKTSSLDGYWLHVSDATTLDFSSPQTGGAE